MFEHYLQTEFMKEYHGDKDHAEDAFDNWLSNRDVQEMYDYAVIWGATLTK